jgi:tetratricopeptide (TPR) repeat protein
MSSKFRKPTPSKTDLQIQAKIERALAHHHQGQYEQAALLYTDVLKTQPKHFEILHLLGLIAFQTGQFARALERINQAIVLCKSNPIFYNNRGLTQLELGHTEAALLDFKQAISLKPDFAEAYYNCANAHQRCMQFEASIACFQATLAINPNNADAYNNLGTVQKRLNLHDAAIASFRQAISLRPNFSGAYSNCGATYTELNQIDQAIEYCKLAVDIDPTNAEAHWNQALALLVAGDLEQGFTLYQWRWQYEKTRQSKRDFAQPLWLGEVALAGKTILLHAEQGFGDAIQFCRYATLVAQLGATVILEVQPALFDLMKNIDGVAQCVVRGEPLPRFDLHCYLLTLPLALKTNLQTIPQAAKLQIATDKLKYWTDQLGANTKQRIGLVWSGNAEHNNDHNRSIDLAQLLPYLPPDRQYVCLQKVLRDTDKIALENRPDITFFGDKLKDFSDTAALCELMDIVISIDTGVAHLSGTLGKPTWILLPFAPDWRWLLDRPDTPWYPSVKLIRQRTIGDWTGAFEQMRTDLIL